MRRVGAGFAVLVLLGALFVTRAEPAFAANLGNAPDGSGNYAQCSLAVRHEGSAGAWRISHYVRCNYGHDGGAEVSLIRVKLNGSVWGGSMSVPQAGGGFGCQGTDAETIAVLDSGTNQLSMSQCYGDSVQHATGWTVELEFGGGTVVWRPTNTTTSAGSTFASFPNDWYNGGTSSEAAPATTGSCFRSLSETGVASFTWDITNPSADHTDVVGIEWGDGTADGGPYAEAVSAANHTYDREAQPVNGWTATLLFTREGDGDPYSAVEVTYECALRVDFDHPENDEAGSTGGGESELSDCLPSGWSFLNPVAYVEGMACVLQMMFIPTDLAADFEEVGDAWDASIVGQGADVFATAFGIPGQMQDGYESQAENLTCEGVTLNLNWGDLGFLPGDPFTGELHPLSTCSPGSAAAASVINLALTLVVYVGFAFLLIRMALSVFGASNVMEGDKP